MQASAESVLLKDSVAARLREAIVQGDIRPGERVVETRWAKEFGVAQASVREAINLLIYEGFLVKNSGRSAQVPQYTRQDVARMYEVRGALEGLAAQLACSSRADLSPLESALTRMETALRRGNVRELIDSDLAFHLALAEVSGNPVLLETLDRLLRPLFTFVLLRMIETQLDTRTWVPDIPRHRQMIDLIRDSEPFVAGQFVQACVGRFVSAAQAVWLPEAPARRRRRPE